MLRLRKIKKAFPPLQQGKHLFEFFLGEAWEAPFFRLFMCALSVAEGRRTPKGSL